MKWSRSNKMKESFNCIAHPHSTSCGKLSSSSVGMDIVMNRWRTMLLQKMFCWTVHRGFISSPLPLHTVTNTAVPNTYLTHKHTQKVFHKLQINLVTKRQSMAPYRQQSCENSLRSVESSDVSYTPKDKAEHRYWLVPSTIYGTKKQGRFWNATSWLFGGANLFYLM